MPIQPLSHGANFVADASAKMNEIVEWINRAERATLTPSTDGKMYLPEMIDIRPLSERVSLLEAAAGR